MHLECAIHQSQPYTAAFNQLMLKLILQTLLTVFIDGGYLLHHVVRDRGEIFSVIFEKYVRYIRRHYGHRLTVVFDDYGDSTKNIKAAEQRRRTTKTSSLINL